MTPAVLYRDEAVLVIDKPAGLPVHRGPRGGPSVEDLLETLRFGKRRPPQPAHRLDADTAGCLVLGRTRPALAALGRAFAEGAVEKTYWAVVRGGPEAEAGEIALPLAKRSSRAAGWRMVVDPAGAPALTLWRVLGRGADRTWLELRPRTGRTHQLRLHCAAMGWPILGDRVYGAVEPGGLALLARSVAIPSLGVAAEAPVPARMRHQGMGGTPIMEGGPGGRPSSPRTLLSR